MRLLYVKPELRDLSQGSRIAFVRQLRHLSQDSVSDYLGLTGEFTNLRFHVKKS